MREPHPQSHVKHQPLGHVKTQTRYISTFIRPMDSKLSRILVILWLLRQRFAQKEIMADPSITLFLSFSVKKCIIYLRSRRDAMESLCLPKINTKMPTRTKSVEMRKIVSNSEIHLHHCLCESRGFKTGRSNHRRCSVKNVFLKFCKIEKKASVPKPTIVFYCQFY